MPSPRWPPLRKNPASMCSACWCRPVPKACRPGRLLNGLACPAPRCLFHLNQLKQAGLVTFRREGRSLIYFAEYDTMNTLLAYLTENCCRGDAAACVVGVCDGATLVKTKPRSTRP